MRITTPADVIGSLAELEARLWPSALGVPQEVFDALCEKHPDYVDVNPDPSLPYLGTVFGVPLLLVAEPHKEREHPMSTMRDLVEDLASQVCEHLDGKPNNGCLPCRARWALDNDRQERLFQDALNEPTTLRKVMPPTLLGTKETP